MLNVAFGRDGRDEKSKQRMGFRGPQLRFGTCCLLFCFCFFYLNAS